MRTAHENFRLATTPGGRSRRAPAAAALVACALLLASCSSSGSDSGTDTGAPTGTSTGATSTDGGSASQQVAAAKAIVEEASQAVTKIPDLEPLKSKPDVSGKKFIWMACDAGTCKDQVAGAKEAAEAAGFEFESLNWKLGDPAGQVSALLQALQRKPAAVGITSLSKAQYAAVIPAYEKAGVVLTNGYSDGGTSGPIISSFEPASGAVKRGEILGNWAIADSNGQANALVVTITEIPSLNAGQESMVSTIKGKCSTCKASLAGYTYADVLNGKAVSGVVSQLLKDKSIDYLLLPLGSMAAGILPALKNAGLEGKIKIAGIGPELQNLENVKNGTEAAYIEINQKFIAYIDVDAALRHMQGMPIDNEVITPERLLTKDSDLEVSTTLNEPADMSDQFKALWQVG